jgi:hypothetical protein
VKEQQASIGAAEFGQVDLSYRVGAAAEKVVYCEESVRQRVRVGREPVAAASSRSRLSDVLPEPRGVTDTATFGRFNQIHTMMCVWSLESQRRSTAARAYPLICS